MESWLQVPDRGEMPAPSVSKIWAVQASMVSRWSIYNSTHMENERGTLTWQNKRDRRPRKRLA